MTFRNKGWTFQLPGFVGFAHSNPPVQQKRKKKRRIDCKVGLMVDKSLASNWWEKQGQITVVHVHYGLFVCQYGRQTSSTTESEWLMTA